MSKAVISTKRIYDPASDDDGLTFLIDRLWPRGIRKEAIRPGSWLKEAAPSNDLRKWFDHDPEKQPEFRRRYVAELEANPPGWAPLIAAATSGPITLLYAGKDPQHTHADVLREFLEAQIEQS